jgi:hypothetical protein
MKESQKLACLVLLLVGLAILMSSIVSAKQAPRASARQQVNLGRQASELKPNVPKSSFGRSLEGARPPFLKADSCSGSCDCSSCSCYGTFDCCSSGCDACWAYRDGRGLCGLQ